MILTSPVKPHSLRGQMNRGVASSITTRSSSKEEEEEEAEWRNVERPLYSRRRGNAMGIVGTLEPGAETACCLAICTAPTCCPMLSACLCCKEAAYITARKNASKYIWIRENSIEWNEPYISFAFGSCFGVDP